MSAPTLAPSTVLQRLKVLDLAHQSMARQDANAFMSYVLKDEETGRPVIQAPHHTEWQRLADQHRRLLIWSHIESGKTQSLAIGRTLFELGKNPNLRVLILSNTDAQAQKVCIPIAKYIEQSDALHRVFPKLVRGKGMPWTNHQLYVQRQTQAKDPSVQTCGVHGNILGSRVDLLILDDLLDYENTLTAAQRDDLWNWYNATVEGRLTRNAKVWCIGTAWHREDIMHRLAKNPQWFAKRYPVLTERQTTSGTIEVSNWPERWPLDRIKEKRNLGPLEFSRQLLCVARSDEDARFKKDWVQTCLQRGLGKPMTKALVAIPQGYRTYTGVDLGVRVKHGSDLTCLFTIVVHPNEDREVLEVDAGRWAGPEIVEKIIDVHRRYGSIVYVENVSAQQFIVDFTKAMSAVPVKPFATGTNQYHPEFGIEGIATEMSNGKWIIPSKYQGGHLVGQNEQIDAWISELLYYDPKGHPGDRLMASWFAQSGSRRVKPKVAFGRLDMSRGGF